jgi:hypothetical protein
MGKPSRRGCHGTTIAASNRERVRRWFIRHPHGTQFLCSEALSLSLGAVQRHCASIADKTSRRGCHGTERADLNRERVLVWFVAHPGGQQRECSKALGLSDVTVHRHLASIRAEWKARDGEVANALASAQKSPADL